MGFLRVVFRVFLAGIASSLSALLFWGCGGAGPKSPKAPEEAVSFAPEAELIPREILFGNPDKVQVRVSPNGLRVAYLAPVDGVMNVWAGPAGDIASAKPVTKDEKRGIRSFFWTYRDGVLVYPQDKDGDENWHVHAVDVEKNETRDLTPIDGVAARVAGVSHLHPDEILVGLNDRDARLHDLYKVDLSIGERTLVQENPGFVNFVVDDEYAVRFGTVMRPDGGMDLMKLKPKCEAPEDSEEPFACWETAISISAEDSLTTFPIEFDKTGKKLYMLDSRGRDTAALVALDLESGQKRLIAESPKADLSDVLLHPTEKTVQAAAFTYEKKDYIFLDDEVKADFERLSKVQEGDIEIASRTLDDNIWVVAFLEDDGPVRYYVFDRAADEVVFLFSHRKDLEGLPLVPMHPVVIESRDGLGLVSYLSLPPGSDEDGDGRPSRPLPMVLMVHGGPWSRVAWGYNPHHQWFANRGYAVLDVNFRGSTGFGKEFINAGDKEWAQKMHNDLLDAVAWAVERDVALEDRVAIFGGSYGGYATLVGLTYTPETFACGVDIVGPSNLVTLLESIPPYWAPMLAMFNNRVGNIQTEEGRKLLKSRSPLHKAQEIRRPLLIAQGANDPRVKQAEADQIVTAMDKNDLPVTYVLYPDEGHGFARPENRLSFYAVTDAFLSECLGGRFEPAGDDFEGSSITVPHGDRYVPGLKDALETSSK